MSNTLCQQGTIYYIEGTFQNLCLRHLRPEAPTEARERKIALLRPGENGVDTRPRALHPPEALRVVDHACIHMMQLSALSLTRPGLPPVCALSAPRPDRRAQALDLAVSLSLSPLTHVVYHIF